MGSWQLMAAGCRAVVAIAITAELISGQCRPPSFHCFGARE